MPVRYLIVDGNFKDTINHHYRYTTELKRVLNGRGIAEKTFVSSATNDAVSSNLSALKYLYSTIYSTVLVEKEYRFLTHWLENNKMAERDLHNVASIGLNENDIILLHSTWSSQAVGIFRWYSRLAEPRPKICLQFQGSHTANAPQEDYELSLVLYKKSLEYWKDIRSRALICSATDEMSAYMTQLSGLPVRTLPTIIDTVAPLGVRMPNPRPVIGFIGTPRPEKGQVLVERLLGRQDSTSNYTFLIQRRSLSRADYLASFAQCDAVILPYLPGNYHLRASAVFAEAIASGCPVIVPPGGWMASELPKWGSPGVVAERYDMASFSAACDTLVADLGLYQDRARQAAPRVQQHFSAENFLDTLAGYGFG